MAIVYAGQTEPGNTDWKDMSNGRGIYVDIDTTVGAFAPPAVNVNPVIYITSLGGKSQHWATTGATSIYKPTYKGFRVYVRWIDGSPLVADFANDPAREWHINWLGRQE
jgi:hypothetical protein